MRKNAPIEVICTANTGHPVLGVHSSLRGILGGFFVYSVVLQSLIYSAFSGSCSAGFMVLTRRAKYSK